MSKLPLSEQLIAATRATGLSLDAMAAETGIHKSALSRFLNRHRGLSWSALDRLGHFLGAELTIRGPKQKAKP